MLEALVRRAAHAGWTQAAVIGAPRGSDDAEGLEALSVTVSPVLFGGDGPGLPFAVPGMSDVMPYASSRFSELEPRQIDDYRNTWTQHLSRVVAGFSPDLIHSNHVWITSSLIKDAAPGVPVVTQCHATGLRQMELCPHLRDGVVAGVRRNDQFITLHAGHAAELTRILDVPSERVHVVGVGYREDIFCTEGRVPASAAPGEHAAPMERILYAGKYSSAKGVPQLLDALAGLTERRGDVTLHIAGAGAGDEADALRDRMERMAPGVVVHGEVGQAELASLMRASDVFVLPSLYEGIPLVLIEALACGCRIVATALPGVTGGIGPLVGDALSMIPMPSLDGIDRLAPGAEDGFVIGIVDALEQSLDRGALCDSLGELPAPVAEALEPYRWTSLFGRIAAVWDEARGGA